MRYSLLSLPACILLCSSIAHAQWSDNFDSYPVGNLAPQGGWEEWTPGAEGYVTTAQFRSAPNSIAIGQATPTGTFETDLVRTYQFAPNPPVGGWPYNSGRWVYTAWQYIPSTMTGTTYFILMNTYFTGGPYNWSVQVEFDAVTGDVEIDAGSSNNGNTALITDQWVKLQVFIDLDADTCEFHYNGIQVGPSYPWTGGVFGQGGGAPEIAAVDLYGNTASDCYYDDISLQRHGDFEQFGNGCPGSTGDVQFNLVIPPSVSPSQVYVMNIDNLPQPACINVLGFSKYASAYGLLPVQIPGAPGCLLRVSDDAIGFLLGSGTGPYMATFSLLGISQPSFVGIRLYQQVLALDPSANALGAITSPSIQFYIQP